jgi:phosphoribosyl 1,2-cyclic phosphate phosphodiesterase
MEILFLGTGTSYGVPVIGCPCAVCTSPDPRNQRMRSAIVVRHAGRTLLVDVPPDFRTQALRHRVHRLDAVLLTHAHVDHILGLDDLRRYTDLSEAYLPCYADEGTLARVQRTFDYAFVPNITYKGRPKLEAILLAERGFDVDVEQVLSEPPPPAFECCGLHVQPVRLRHGWWATTDFVFTDPAGRRCAYLTDCNGIPPQMRACLRGLDLLILDALRPEPHPTHFTLAEAVSVATELRPRRTLFTHLSHALDHAATNEQLPDGMALAYDGQVVRVGVME